MNRVIFILMVSLAGTQAFSQHSSRAYLKVADSLYQYHSYQFAADYYQKAFKKSADPGNIMLKIARSYIKINRADEAEKWFIEANSNHVPFTLEDDYQYAKVLIALKKRNKAEVLLDFIVKTDSNAHLARRALADLRDYQRYYQDSAAYRVDSLSVNTAASEFAPVYYKNGIVFTSARESGMFRKKSQWDNSDFLNLFFAAKIDSNRFESPVIFDKQLNTQYHDGPASFYDEYQKMIINRNQLLLMPGKVDIYELRPGLFDAYFDQQRPFWHVTPLPFNDAAYTYAHPSISEDGNTLFFVSNQSGGHGGTDIYRVERANGVWGKPFNLGPPVNTAEDEAFPFFTGGTLYFASNGHGGIGGLDIFSCTQTLNGFTPPINLGYPINSNADDFSLITDLNQRNGYFSSSRKGNDDLFSFQKVLGPINILAQVLDGLTNELLDSAQIQLITDSGIDTTLTVDDMGNVNFDLPEETAFAIIGTEGDKIGMVPAVALKPTMYPIPVFIDTSRIACIGIIQNEQGMPKKASAISITDETTGEVLNHPGDKSLVTFMGEKGHNYMVEVEDNQGSEAKHQVVIGSDDEGTKTWIMVLPDIRKNLTMAARVFRADNDQPLPYADVRIITFSETDQELTTDSVGMVDFSLVQGTAFVIIGSKGDLIGTNSGTATPETEKTNMIYPVPAYGDRQNNVIAMGLVTNKSGTPVEGFEAVVKDKATGQNIPLQIDKGLLTFQGQHGNAYNIAVSHEDYRTTLQELALPETGPDVEKFTVILEDLDIPQAKKFPVFATVPVVTNIKTGKSDLLVFDTEEGTSKMFIKSGEAISEITERDSILYRMTPRGNVFLGKGDISKLRNNPSTVLKGLERSDMINLRNIYFEFDKSNLHDEDLTYLQYVKNILEHDPSFELLIAGHADDRGSDSYNIKLSRRRAMAVSNYLVHEGIDKERITLKAYGESLPVVPCYHKDCSEEDYQKNRRAEFVLSHGFRIPTTPLPKPKPKT